LAHAWHAWDTLAPLPHRQEQVATWRGPHGDIVFVNDSKATNPDSALHALRTYPRIYWIVGGKPKAEGITPLLPHVEHVVHAYTIGEAGPAFADALAPYIPALHTGTLEAAVQAAATDATRQSVGTTAYVLLAPACASFDQFRDFEARGEAFAAYARAWIAQHPPHASSTVIEGS
jgi:UDP-N-acetylmuramoylalanine--D-glutamate ligase